MGTSKSYEMPSGTNWRQTKNSFSRAASKIDSETKPNVAPLLKNYFHSTGGSKSYSRSGSGLSNSRGAIQAGKGLGNFFNEISEEGFESTFEKFIGDRVAGKSTSDICLELTDFFCQEASFSNDADAKSAMYKLLEELLENVEDGEEIEDIFENHATNEKISKLVERYFGFYIIEQINRSFFGDLEKKYGFDKANKLVHEEIKPFVLERTREENKTRDFLSQDFSDPNSSNFIEKILQEVISIFE